MICADVGGSFVDIALVSGDGTITHRQKRATPTDSWSAFVSIFDDFQVAHADALAPADGVSIATAGLIDPSSGRLTSANIASIHDRVLARDLTDALGRSVTLINDADAFVLAETAFGVARGHSRVFGVILGTGVGGGLIEGGAVVTGAGGVGGEWGHGQVVTRSSTHPDATPCFPCGCGREGCLDTVGGARGLERLHRYLHAADATSREVLDAWRAGDAAARATIDLYGDLMAGPLAMVLNTFPATIVPVGGGLSGAADLIAELDRRVRKQMLHPPAEPILAPTALGADAGLLGAFMAHGGD